MQRPLRRRARAPKPDACRRAPRASLRPRRQRRRPWRAASRPPPHGALARPLGPARAPHPAIPNANARRRRRPHVFSNPLRPARLRHYVQPRRLVLPKPRALCAILLHARPRVPEGQEQPVWPQLPAAQRRRPRLHFFRGRALRTVRQQGRTWQPVRCVAATAGAQAAGEVWLRGSARRRARRNGPCRVAAGHAAAVQRRSRRLPLEPAFKHAHMHQRPHAHPSGQAAAAATATSGTSAATRGHGTGSAAPTALRASRTARTTARGRARWAAPHTAHTWHYLCSRSPARRRAAHGAERAAAAGAGCRTRARGRRVSAP